MMPYIWFGIALFMAIIEGVTYQLVSIWFVYGAVCRYKIVLKEGPYAHYAYFEKKDNEA